MKRFPLLLLPLAVFLALLCWLTVPMPAGKAQSGGSTITLVGPPACPPGGCAAGQRLSYQLDFVLGDYDASLSGPNVKVCVYIPTSWYNSATVQLDTTGGVTGNTYNSTNCPEDLTPPTNYTLAAAGEAAFNGIFVFQDSLNFSFRIAAAATSPGSILARIYEQVSAGTWTRTSQVFTPQMTPIPTAGVVYVAGSPASCSANPCYLNSTGDGAGGIGTGLKDAVDAVAPGSRVIVLGSVALKGTAVIINRQVSLEGSGDATLTSSGGNCTHPLLEITTGGSLRGLTINDGGCTSTNRDLLVVDTPAAYAIESNTLTGGKNAIYVKDNTGSLTVSFNQIQGNSGYALFWDAGAGAGGLRLVANNIVQNGNPVECSAGAANPVANRIADHNYWGGNSPDAAATHCTINAAKRLGAPIQANSGIPGVSAERVMVTTTKTYRFGNQIGLSHSAEGADFDLYIINHGPTSPDGVPFTNFTGGSLNPCSNYWDLFLAEGAVPGGSLDLFFKYNRSSACAAVIESSQFCELTTNTTKFPLWWYDPAGQVTAGWDTTGQNPAGSGAGGASGQATTCDMLNDEIRVTMDNTGRPSLANDLNFTPFMVGIPVPATFQTLASNNTVTVRWTTTSEVDLNGFYVLRSMAASGPFSPISDIIARKGSATAGSDYSFVDGGRTNGVTNYYRLQIERSDGTYFFSDILSIIPNVATITPTPTPSRTMTLVPTRTATVRISTATRAPTVTRRVVTPTRGVIFTPTLARSPTRTVVDPLANIRTLTALAEAGYPRPEETVSADPDVTGYPDSEGPGYPGVDQTLISGTSITPAGTSSTQGATASVTRTPTPDGETADGENPRSASDWISLVLGLLMSGGVVFGLTWFFFLRRKE
jgi:hypothetical protein